MKSRSQTTTLVQDIFTTAEHLAAEAREDFGDATHRMRDVTSKAMNSVLHTLHFDQLPSWMQNDPYIQRGYRKPTGAIKDCLYSLCYPHNELVNTWSHLLPAMFFIALLVGVDYLELKELEHLGKEIRWEDLAMMQFYFVCTALCLLFSATFHGMNCHSVDMARRTLKLDYLGIVLTISSTCITSTYFGLYDNPRLQAIYISFTVLCGTTVFWMVLKPGVDGAHAAAWRAVVFICLGASGFGAIIHAGLTKGMEGLNPFPFPNIAITCSCYLVGAFLYVHRIPEKQWPGIFDLWGASHQLFHVLVAVGQIVFLYGLKDVLLLHYQDTSPIPMPLVGSNVHSWSLQQPVLGFCSNLSHSALESCAIMCT